MPDSPEPTSVQTEPQSCALCTTAARYKCPRCATPTCSLLCSRRHKQVTGCTGERDKTRYIPMNTYGWGAMMRDYCYLEDVGRRVGDWGSEIIRGGYMDNTNSTKAGKPRKASSGRRPRSKRDVFKDHLETLGIDVEFLPAGMERRNLNQSTFDLKSKCPLFTVELVCYPPTTLASVLSSLPPPYKIILHRNSLSATLLAILQRHVSLANPKQKENTPDWLPSIVAPHPEAPECFVPPHCYMRANTEFPQASNTTYYHQLEPTLSLGELFQRTSFIEFPTVHVYDPEASSFYGIVIDKSGSIIRSLEGHQTHVAKATKRKKLNKTAGLNTVFGLVGGYRSESSSPSEGEIAETRTLALTTLGVYSGSDDEVDPRNIQAEEIQSLNSDNDIFAESNPDPLKLLEIVKLAQCAADDDILDWGDESSVDVEA